jgi:hypothetical protein
MVFKIAEEKSQSLIGPFGFLEIAINCCLPVCYERAGVVCS